MANNWILKETNTHQDHVIAHVIGATVLAHFVFDEVLYLLLDIGFVWNIFLNGEMGLLPHPVTVSELEVDSQTKEQIKRDIDAVLSSRDHDLAQLRRVLVPCLINEVNFFAEATRHLLVLTSEVGSLEIDLSSDERTIEVREVGIRGQMDL